MDVRFLHGSSHLMVGASGAGKTFRLAEYLKRRKELISGGSEINNVVFYYSVWQPIYDSLKDNGHVTQWIKASPSNDDFINAVKDFKHSGGSIVCIDDQMGDISKELLEIVAVSSRHYNATTFILFQCLFPPMRFARQISLQIKYFHLFKNPRENSQIATLARQLYPQNWKWIVEAFHAATGSPFSCFLIDLTQTSPEKIRFRSNFLPSEFPIIVWGKKGSFNTSHI